MSKDDKGIIWVPWVTKISATNINGETVWYANKWKNFLLKIKFFFFKPKYNKLFGKYPNKPVDPSLYGTIKVGSNKSKWVKIEDKSDGPLSWTEYTDDSGFVFTIYNMCVDPAFSGASIKEKEYYAVYEKVPAHGREANGIILAPYNSIEDAQAGREKYGYNTDNYYVDKIKINEK